MISRFRSLSIYVFLCFSLAGLAGCGGVQGPASGGASQSPAVQAAGMVHGGEAPITGATIQLWAVGNTGYGSAATALINQALTPVTSSDGSGAMNSNANAGNGNNTLAAGGFTITGDYTCPANDPEVYLTASGGNPGLSAGTNNSAILLMAALTDCNTLKANAATTFISINEVTTVASIYSLAQFASISGNSVNIGTVSTTTTGIVNAFGNVANLAKISTGVALASDSAGNTVPQSQINTIANILVPCVNSNLPTSSNCNTLFTTVGNVNGSLPTTVLTAAYGMAISPYLNLNALYSIATAAASYQPSLSGAPSNWDLVVGGAAQSNCGYSGSGVKVSGTVSYSGASTGRTYLELTNNSCGGGGTQGVSISSKGSYSIRGVPPGTYTLNAFMDPSSLGYGQQNASDPSGSTTVTVASADIGSQNVTLLDPGTVTVTSAPSIQNVTPFNSGTFVQFNAVKSNGVEVPASYTLQWSTTSSFTAIAGSQIFPAAGTHAPIWLVNGLTDGSVYYFRAYGTSSGTAQGPYSSTVGPVTIGEASTGNAVSGSVTFSGTATGPMYVGLYNQYSGFAYAEYIPNPVNSQPYTVVVPNSTAAVYQPFAIIDQNKDGVVDTGDIQDVDGESYAALQSITGTTANENITLPSGNSVAMVQTQHYFTGAYGINLKVSAGVKLPVAVALESSSNPGGANVSGPMDIARCQNNGSCNGQGFQIGFALGTTAPAVGDTYFFQVTYSDGTSEFITAADTAVLNSFATNLGTPGTSVSTRPTFSWNAPVCGACSTYVYDFYLQQTNSNTIWSVPSNADGLPYSTTSLAWGVDPTDSGNTPSVASLTAGTNYSWNIEVVDGYGNQAITQANYTP